MEYIDIVVFIITSVVFFLIYYTLCASIQNNKQSVRNLNKCSSTSCQNIDPVSDPKYNMQQIVKQSILLEEHLANKNKRCRDCITKHFLHIIGLAEEAQMLATNKIDKYPLVNECVELYNKLFNRWMKNYDINANDSNNFLYCCDELRNMRKRLIAVYFFDDKTSLSV